MYSIYIYSTSNGYKNVCTLFQLYLLRKTNAQLGNNEPKAQ